MAFVEQNCTFTHEGRTVESGGACVTEDVCIAYLGADGVLTDWHGNQLGTYKIVSTWTMWNAWGCAKMNAVHATVDGKLYKGRSQGLNMSFRGKRSR